MLCQQHFDEYEVEELLEMELEEFELPKMKEVRWAEGSEKIIFFEDSAPSVLLAEAKVAHVPTLREDAAFNLNDIKYRLRFYRRPPPGTFGNAFAFSPVGFADVRAPFLTTERSLLPPRPMTFLSS